MQTIDSKLAESGILLKGLGYRLIYESHNRERPSGNAGISDAVS